MPLKNRDRASRDTAEALAIRALAFVAQEPERLGRFLAMTGLGPETLRAAASDPSFLASVIDHVTADEGLLLAFAAHESINPATVAQARDLLVRSEDAWPIGHGG